MTPHPLPVGMAIEDWPPDDPAIRTSPHSKPRLQWIDLDWTVSREEAADAIDALDLSGYKKVMLGFVLAGQGPEDPGNDSVPWFDPHVSAAMIRNRSPRYLRASGLEPEIGPGHYERPWVFVMPVHFVAGDGWLVTCRHGSRASDGDNAQMGGTITHERLRAMAAARWRDTTFESSGDLAMTMVRGLAGTFQPSLNAVGTHLNQLQQAFVRGIDEGTRGWLDATEYRRRLLRAKWVIDTISVTVADLSRPATEPGAAWFRLVGASDAASQTQTLIEAAMRTVAELRSELRQDFSLIAATDATSQLALAHATQQAAEVADQRSRRFEEGLQIAAAVFLPPTLVATIFGALPAIYEDCPDQRFVLVVGLTIASAVLGVITVRCWQARGNSTEGDLPAPED